MNEGQGEAKQVFDVIIVGAGPSGTCAALVLNDKGYRVGIVDKATFPRDKVCGDALSPDVLSQLNRLAPRVLQNIVSAEKAASITGIDMVAPNGKKAVFQLNTEKKYEGYVVSRIDLDNALLNEVKQHTSVEVIENCEVREILRSDSGVSLETSLGSFFASLIIGADGNNSVVARQLAGRKQIDRKHHCAALRCYYENVAWPDGNSRIELRFLKSFPAGYLWVFPMSGNRANVGIGMLSHYISKKKYNLRDIMAAELQTNPELAERFKEARPLETVKGFGIPIGSKRYSLSGDRYLLSGDAACLVDPLSGEGIANAIRSGRYAGEYAAAAISSGRTDAASLKEYDKKIYALVGNELKLGYYISLCFRSDWLVNRVIGLLNRNQGARSFLRHLFADTAFYSDWARASFYMKALGLRRK